MVIGVLAVVYPRASASNQPNIIVIYTDDQRWDTLCWEDIGLTDICSLPAADHPMPLAERLMAYSVVFSNAFVPDPLCCPARGSFHAGGFHPHNTNVLDNELPNGSVHQLSDSVTLATQMQLQGYTTALVGKYLNKDDEWVDPITGESYVPPGWDHYASVPGTQDDWWNPLVVFGSSTPTEPSVGSSTVLSDTYVTTFLADESLAFIRDTCQFGSCEAPFFLFIGTSAPHWPATADTPYETLFSDFVYDERGFGEPDGDITDKPYQIQQWSLQWWEDQDLEFRRRQMRTLRSVDDMLGELVRLLRRRALLNNTVIIFASDNGFMWGEHKLTKKIKPYEESIRVPMFVFMPGVAPRTEDNLVSANLDLPATILDLAGVDPLQTDGLSLVPLLQDPATPWRDALLIQHFDSGVGTPYTWAAVRTEDYKYVELVTGEVELYDLSADPFELQSQHNNPAYDGVEALLAAQLDAMQRGASVRFDNLLDPFHNNLPEAVVGQAYTFQLLAWGGNGDYTWSHYVDPDTFCPADLPPGVSISTAGEVNGTPTASGTWSFCVKLEDSSISPQPGNGRPQSHIVEFVLTVLAP